MSEEVREDERPDDLGESNLRGSELWELALRGGGQIPAELRSHPPPRTAKRPRLPKWTLGVLALVVAGIAAGLMSLLATGKAASSHAGSSAAPAGSNSTVPLAPPDPGRVSTRTCSAAVAGLSAPAGATVQIAVSQVPQGAAVTVDLDYPGGTASYSVPSSQGGVADVTVTVPDVAPGQLVEASVTAGSSSCRTSFSPAASPAG
jgi:hypothetical protein